MLVCKTQAFQLVMPRCLVAGDSSPGTAVPVQVLQYMQMTMRGGLGRAEKVERDVFTAHVLDTV